MFWLWQTLVMALPTWRRLAWALAQVSQAPGAEPAVCVGTLRLLLASLLAALGTELPGVTLSDPLTLDDGHGEVDWGTSGEVLISKTSGKLRFECFSAFPAWGAGCSAGSSSWPAFFWAREHRTDRARIKQHLL